MTDHPYSTHAPGEPHDLGTALRDGTCATTQVLLDLAGGVLDLPDALTDSVVRWRWAADLLTHPAWGLVTVTPQHRELFVDVADLCRETAIVSADNSAGDVLSSQVNSLALDWRDTDAAATTAMSSVAPGAEWNALEAIVELVTDGLDALTGRGGTGTEVVTAVFTTYLDHHGHDRARTVFGQVLAHADTLADHARHARRSLNGRHLQVAS